ncbi:serine hydrolase [Paludisphaera mucosa]|uniref:beta-lactamase n=1 Tax=Paludisphaera mucosa TaxID=3030827 RepID=A0ABT6F7T9_9BACT|nr:serine hydrolase [Paludisphaera mucosa]MDG3003478.1 class A beta-lactamase-related serine hydrolase [Paludisphaera mucosa]
MPDSIREQIVTRPRCSGRRAVLMLVAAATLALGASADAAQEPTPPTAAAPPSLAERIEKLTKAHKGKASVALKNLKTGESYSLAADEPMPTASLIKFPVMIEAYRQAAEGKIDLNAPVTLRKQDKVPGSGILTDHFSDGAIFPLVDAVHAMIAFSDNTATNIVLDAIGIGSTAATMEKLGCPNTKIHSKVFRRDTSVFPERSKLYGLGSTTAAEMVRLFEELNARKLVDEKASEAMWKHLLSCDDKAKFPRFLPPGTKVAFKTGSVDESRTCAGVIETKGGAVALCVMTTDNEDQSWTDDNAGNLLCAKVAREVYDYFTAKAQPPKPEPASVKPAEAASPASR